MSQRQVPELKIRQFEGPLDLLFHLIEKNDIDLYDIPIAEVTDQYLTFLNDMDSLDMEVASEFLVMAATLIHIKSRMLLPDKRQALTSEQDDPREELVIRLLQYRRCKMLARELRDRYKLYQDLHVRLPLTPDSLGVKAELPPQEFDAEQFRQSISTVSARNEMRFADISSKITHILQRDKVSVRDKMRFVWQKIVTGGRAFFHELFPVSGTSRIDKVVGFLAILELLRGNRITAVQDKPFDVILLEKLSDQERAARDLSDDVAPRHAKENYSYDG